MKSEIPGCARMCADCPKRADRAVLFNADTIRAVQKDIDNNTDTFVMPEIDPLDVDRISQQRVYDLFDYGNKDAEIQAVYSQVQRADSLVTDGPRGAFPFTLTLDMIEQCQQPVVEQHSKWRFWAKKQRCGAYLSSLALINEDMRTEYDQFLTDQDRR